jgi:hypothetical protein
VVVTVGDALERLKQKQVGRPHCPWCDENSSLAYAPAGWSQKRNQSGQKINRMKTEPNNAMEPTPVNVTIPADAGLAPFTSVAHL